MRGLSSHGPEVYLTLVMDVWPLLVLAFVIAFLRGWEWVKRSFFQRDFWSTFFNILLSSCLTAFATVGVVLCLSLFGVVSSDRLDLGLTILLSAGGMKAVDAFLRWRAGGAYIRPQNQGDLRDMHAGMDDDERLNHKSLCPFFNDGSCSLGSGVKHANDV